ESAQNRDNRCRFRRFGRKDPPQRGRGGSVLAFNQKALCRLPTPKKRAGTFASESLRIKRDHVSRRSAGRIAMTQAIDAPAFVPDIDPVLLLEMTGDGRVIFDDFTIVISDPDAAVRPVREVHRMTPRIGAGAEFGFFFTRRAPQFERGTVLLDERPMEQISRRLAGEILS